MSGDIPVFGTGGQMSRVNKFLYDGESVFIGRKGTINKPGYFKGKFWTVDTLFYTHSFQNVLPKFVLYLFENINWLNYNEASGVPSLSKSTIEKIGINIPTITEQVKICKTLSLIDTRIQTQSKIIQQLETLMQNLRERLFVQQVRFKNNNRNLYSKWEERKLKDIAIKKSSNISANKIEENFGDYVIYGASGILKKIDFYEEENDYIGIVKDGAGVGRLFYCNGKSSVLGTMDIIEPTTGINAYFLFYLLSCIDFSKYVSGSTIPHIYFKDYKNEKCSIPSLEEQNRIASFLLSISNKIEIEKQQLLNYEKQKKYLLQNLFI